MIVLKRLISGGQTGADQGGLEAGKQLGLETGGWVPKGCMTEAGPNKDLVTTYGCTESHTSDYQTRTRQNVDAAGGTVWFGYTYTPGYWCTHNRAKHRTPWIENPTKENFLRWLSDNGIEILNVAGNRESKNRGLRAKVKDFLVDALRQV